MPLYKYVYVNLICVWRSLGATVFTVVRTAPISCPGIKKLHDFLPFALLSLISSPYFISEPLDFKFSLTHLIKRLGLIVLINVCPWCVWPSIICSCAYATVAVIIYIVTHLCISVPLSRQTQQGEGSPAMKMMMKTVHGEEVTEQMDNRAGTKTGNQAFVFVFSGILIF